MAKYDKSRKYWLQLREDWFEEDSIKWLESQKNGKEYSLFYMKLMVKSIKTNGYLIRQVGKLLIPYDSVAISELTRTDVDTVMIAMNLLREIGLVEILEDGAIFIEAVEKMIGSTTISAIKKQEQLKRREENLVGWNKGGKNSTKDITITKAIIKEKEKYKKEKEKHCQSSTDEKNHSCSTNYDNKEEDSASNCNSSASMSCSAKVNCSADTSDSKANKGKTLEVIQADEKEKSYYSLLSFWNSFNIISHKQISDSAKKSIVKALGLYSMEQIKVCIERYAEVLKDKTYFFKYKWTLQDFLSRRDGISSFLDEGSKWINYCEHIGRTQKNDNTVLNSDGSISI